MPVLVGRSLPRVPIHPVNLGRSSYLIGRGSIKLNEKMLSRVRSESANISFHIIIMWEARVQPIANNGIVHLANLPWPAKEVDIRRTIFSNGQRTKRPEESRGSKKATCVGRSTNQPTDQPVSQCRECDWDGKLSPRVCFFFYFAGVPPLGFQMRERLPYFIR